MRAQDLIERKRDGGELSAGEIAGFVAGIVDGSVPDYQAAAFLMAVYFQGMSDAETAALTDAMVRSGERLDFTGRPSRRVDKHSTGGVGDKISLPLGPAVAACGGQVPMISGRSLGHTGGTLDKLESIPGFNVRLTLPELRRQVDDLGLAFGAATDDLAPADRKLYQLRDVTGTVASIPLITSSILSKKAAEGLDGLVLDVKTGSGAFMPELRSARRLAETLVATGERLGVRTVALLTDMQAPLGVTIGNALEIRETIDVLRGAGPADVVELTVALGGEMLWLSDLVDSVAAGRERIARSLADGSALCRFHEVVRRQGGDVTVIDDPDRLPTAAHHHVLRAPRAGFVVDIDARSFGVAAGLLGAGRATVADRIDPAVGFRMLTRVGERLAAMDPIVEIHYNDGARLAAAVARLESAVTIADEAPPARRLLIDRVAT